MIKKNKSLLKKILQEWFIYTLKQYKKRTDRKNLKK